MVEALSKGISNEQSRYWSVSYLIVGRLKYKTSPALNLKKRHAVANISK